MGDLDRMQATGGITFSAHGITINTGRVKLVFPFLYTRSLTIGRDHPFARYRELFSRLIFASPEALKRLCRNEQLLQEMRKILIEQGKIDFLGPFSHGLTVRRLGEGQRFFALILSGKEPIDKYLREFYALERAGNYRLKDILYRARNHMARGA